MNAASKNTLNNKNNHTTSAGRWFCLFIALKQFYLFPSGSLGLGDICLVISFLCLIRAAGKNDFTIKIFKQDTLWYIFLFFVIMINCLHAYFAQRAEFLKYALFWCYNGMAIWCFRSLIGKPFLKSVSLVCKFNIMFQFIVYLSGMGRFFHEGWGGSRNMGTFNDPNQCAFFIFVSMLFLYLYYCDTKDKSFPLFLGISTFLVLACKSTGMFAGLAAFFAGIIIREVWRLYASEKIPKLYWGIAAVVLLCCITAGIYVLWPAENFDIQRSDYTLISRIQQKIWKFSNGNFADILYDRSAEKLVLYPQYLIYGAGEGCYDRFVLGDYINQISKDVFVGEFVNEIHSSLFSIWFCYGIFPTAVLLGWLYHNIRSVSSRKAIAVAALLLESFLLVNYRQPFFLMVLIYAGYEGKHLSKKD